MMIIKLTKFKYRVAESMCNVNHFFHCLRNVSQQLSNIAIDAHNSSSDLSHDFQRISQLD